MNKIYTLIIFFLCFLNFYYLNSSKTISNPQIDLKTKLETTYHLKIYTKNEALLNSEDFKINPITNENTINTALLKLKTTLELFPPEFFNIFSNNDLEGLNIYLTGKLTPFDLNQNIANPAAFSLFSNSRFIMAIDITNSNISNLFCHELMHNIEYTLTDKFIFPDWNSYNPPDFLYDLSYTKKSNPTYTLNNLNPENIYFIDTYSKTYPDEDRARIFEYICTQNANLSKYENLSLKAKYLQKELLTYYPILKTSPLFKTFSS